MPVYRLDRTTGLLLVGCVVLGVIAFYEPLARMVEVWASKEEYSYGYFVPFITGFWIWQRWPLLRSAPLTGSWVGVLVVLGGVFIYFLGALSTIYIVSQYGALVVVFGIALALLGWRGLRLVLMPLIFLAFMIPLPVFLYNSLSTTLQLISSEVGVGIIRLFDISVFLQGNVIDLGTYKLQVADACSGLRYLFPLAALSFMAAYVFRGRLWKKALIFLSSIPIAIGINSFRIGVIGVVVENVGIDQAQGFLHYFEGWILFLTCLGVLVLEMWGLSKIGGDRVRSFAEAFALEFPTSPPPEAEVRYHRLSGPVVGLLAVLVAAMAGSLALGQREERIPQRADFSRFPMELGSWQGQPDTIQPAYLKSLELDDYLMADYRNGTGQTVNFYVAYYDSQRAGASVHSPRSCIPGGGWKIADLSQRSLEGVSWNGEPLTTNRVVIRRGNFAQLVYYWFQQRGRNLTNEYLVKWFLFWDSLTRARTDGALVRLTTPVAPDGSLKQADARLRDLTEAAVRYLDPYIPE